MPHHKPRVSLPLGFKNPITIQTGILGYRDQFKSSEKELVHLSLSICLTVLLGYLSRKLKPRHIHVTAGTNRRSISAYKPRYIPGIPGPKDAEHTNDWCISTGQVHEPSELPGMSSLKRPIRDSLALGRQYQNKSCFKQRTTLCMVLSESI